MLWVGLGCAGFLRMAHNGSLMCESLGQLWEQNDNAQACKGLSPQGFTTDHRLLWFMLEIESISPRIRSHGQCPRSQARHLSRTPAEFWPAPGSAHKTVALRKAPRGPCCLSWHQPKTIQDDSPEVKCRLALNSSSDPYTKTKTQPFCKGTQGRVSSNWLPLSKSDVNTMGPTTTRCRCLGRHVAFAMSAGHGSHGESRETITSSRNTQLRFNLCKHLLITSMFLMPLPQPKPADVQPQNVCLQQQKGRMRRGARREVTRIANQESLLILQFALILGVSKKMVTLSGAHTRKT